MFYYKTEDNDYISSMSPYSGLEEITKEEYDNEVSKINEKADEEAEEQIIIQLAEKGYTIYK